MADDQAPKQSKSSSKSAGRKLRGGLAPVQGDYTDDRAPEDTPGDPAHLGSDRPYEGGDSPFVEGDEAAQRRGD